MTYLERFWHFLTAWVFIQLSYMLICAGSAIGQEVENHEFSVPSVAAGSVALATIDITEENGLGFGYAKNGLDDEYAVKFKLRINEKLDFFGSAVNFDTRRVTYGAAIVFNF